MLDLLDVWGQSAESTSNCCRLQLLRELAHQLLQPVLGDALCVCVYVGIQVLLHGDAGSKHHLKAGAQAATRLKKYDA
jgi:hypothetical protein